MIPLRQCAGIAMLGCLLVLAPASTRAAVTEDQFVARTAGDLAALCSADPSDRLYTAAVNFCHGFGAGTYGVLSEVENANPKVRLFCAPQVQPTRNEVVAAFVSWTHAQPARAVMPAVDGVAAFLADTYPCPKPAGRPASRRTP